MKENNTYHNERAGNNLPDSLRVNPFIVPQHFFEDQNELILSQVKLRALKNDDALSTPEGYFEELTNNILARVTAQSLKEQVSKDGFEVPQGYFEKLEDAIYDSIIAQTFKDEIPKDGFEVPQGYFESSSQDILSAIAEDNLKSKIATDGFEVPEMYFENLEDNISAHIFADNLKEEIGQQGYQLPQGYFDTLTSSILSKIHEPVIEDNTTEKDTQIIKMPARRKWITYASAAAMAVFLGMGIYFFEGNTVEPEAATMASSATRTYESEGLREISNEEIVNYLAFISDGDDLLTLSTYIEESSNVENVIDTEDIEEYLNYML